MVGGFPAKTKYVFVKDNPSLVMASWETTLFTIFNSWIIILGGCANLLVICSFILFSCAREGTSFFLINLSVADFLVCAVYQPLLVFRFNHPNQNKSFLLTQSFLGFGLFTASLNGLLTVTFDRFVAIYFPYKYVIWITEKITVRFVLTAWMVSLMMGILNCISRAGLSCAHKYTTAVIIAVPILYAAIYREARKQARRIMKLQRGRQRVIRKATKGVGVVVVATLLCWLPLVLCPTFLSSLETDEERLKALLWCVTAGCIGCCINPFIYFYKFQYFRRNVTKLFRRIWSNFSGRNSINREI